LDDLILFVSKMRRDHPEDGCWENLLTNWERSIDERLSTNEETMAAPSYQLSEEDTEESNNLQGLLDLLKREIDSSLAPQAVTLGSNDRDGVELVSVNPAGLDTSAQAVGKPDQGKRFKSRSYLLLKFLTSGNRKEHSTTEVLT